MAITRRILLKMAAPLALLTSANSVHAAETASGNGGEHQKRKKTTSYAKEKIFSEVHITDFGGGVGKPPSINGDALSKAKIAASGGRVIFPTPGVYDFPLNTDFTGFIMSPVDGVVIRGPGSFGLVRADIVTDNDYRVYIDSGLPKNYYIDIRANYHVGSKGANKSLWISNNDLSESALNSVDPRTIPIMQFIIGKSDEIVKVVPAGYSDRTLYLTPPVGGGCQMGVVPALPGQELTVGINIPPNNNGEVVAGFLFSSGYAVLRGSPTTNSWLLTKKYKGVMSIDSHIDAIGGETITYSPSSNLLTVRSISPDHGQVLINGVVAADVKVKDGSIQWMGFGSTSTDATLISSINLNGWYSSTFKVASSPRSQTLGVIGDSISDGAIHGSWAPWCAEALDGSLGIRIDGIENRAISGQTLSQQVENLKVNPFVKASVVAIFIGTNDIQGDNTLADFQSSMLGILDKLDAENLPHVLVIPPQWYLRSDTTTNLGGETTNSNRGGDIRAAIGRIAADRNLTLVDMTRITGTINPDYLHSTFADSMLRDNLHPTAYAYRIYGYEIAKAIASALCPVVNIPSKWIDVPTLSEGVSGILRYRYTSEGVQLSGEINIAKPSNGVIATLPLNIAPPAIRRFVTWGTNDLIKTAINTDGTIEVINSGSGVISMDNITIAY